MTGTPSPSLDSSHISSTPGKNLKEGSFSVSSPCFPSSLPEMSSPPVLPLPLQHLDTVGATGIPQGSCECCSGVEYCGYSPHTSELRTAGQGILKQLCSYWKPEVCSQGCDSVPEPGQCSGADTQGRLDPAPAGAVPGGAWGARPAWWDLVAAPRDQRCERINLLGSAGKDVILSLEPEIWQV